MKKIYFAGSIRGGRADAELYARMIDYMKEQGQVVLTEHVGHPELNLLERGRDRDGEIYAQDTAWLRESELLVGEVSCPSLGVGYELAYAERNAVVSTRFKNLLDGWEEFKKTSG